MESDFAVTVDGVRLGGRLRGSGDPVLLLHGGPALGFEYLDPVVEELQDSFTVATHQQRGLPPSRTEGPFDVSDHVADVRRVLDGLGWERAVVIGHSWGGHLALHVAHRLADRVRAMLAIDPMGGVGDGGAAAFVAELEARTPAADWQRANELDERAEAGTATAEDLVESVRLLWPAYFPTREVAPPMPETRLAHLPYVETMASAYAELPGLEADLATISVPVGFLAGAVSPIPTTTSSETADRIPGAWVDVVDGAGHFVWHERPGLVLDAVRRLVGHG